MSDSEKNATARSPELIPNVKDLQSESFDHAHFLKNLTQRPGVYQMFAEGGELLYVGKAKNLKNRVSSYFRASGLNNKTVALVSRIANIDVTVTTTETEALLLEHNLIKSHRPPFNILLRDDKSYPYIFLSDGEFPRVAYHRGSKRAKGKYFGPYPNASSVRESLTLLQRVFKVRQCDDSYYANRSRACLQHQIKRCSAPCVDLVSAEQYAEQVRHTRWFLEGKSDELLTDLGQQMNHAAEALNYEEAAEYRDQIQHLKRVTEQQFIESGNAQADVIAGVIKAGKACIHILFIRGGRILGSRTFYPTLTVQENEGELLLAFLGQYYLGEKAADVPAKIICSATNDDYIQMAEAISLLHNSPVIITATQRGIVDKWLDLAKTTAEQNLSSRLAAKKSIVKRFEHLQEVLALADMPERIECFDISHSSGEAAVASCVVFDQGGPVKSDYRRFNIDGITGGDDYAAMHQALSRRFKRLLDGEGKRPDILLIDGGKGQVSQAFDVLQGYGLMDILIIGVAKGPERKAGLEQLILANGEGEFSLADDAPALHLIQHVRDESHRFAVKSHTQRRDKKRKVSMLEGIPGVGAKRRKALLSYFGSSKAVTEAPVRELKKVAGISATIAEDIYANFHKDA